LLQGLVCVLSVWFVRMDFEEEMLGVDDFGWI
jgi:hypothetical protein